MINLSLRKLARRYRRNLFEFFGSTRYSMTAPYGIDKQLEAYLPQSGFFIEVGANDGVSESNTYYLERIKGWKGILIEPIPQLYQECVKARPNSQIFNCALVSSDYLEPTVVMEYRHLMSLVKGALGNSEVDAKHLAVAKQYHNLKPYEIKVPARTMTSILDECKITEIDFFSLDVEGFEVKVLKGLNFNKYRPKFILIEMLFEPAQKEIEAYISNLYSPLAQLSERDYLYQRK